MTNPIQLTRPIIVFDGVCVLCNRSVHFIIMHDTQKLFRLVSMQATVGQQLLRDHGLDSDDPSSLLLIDESGAHTDTDAIIRVVCRFGGVWKLISIMRIVPPDLRDLAYRWVAKNRYHWFGKRETCMVPTPDIAERFIQ